MVSVSLSVDINVLCSVHPNKISICCQLSNLFGTIVILGCNSVLLSCTSTYIMIHLLVLSGVIFALLRVIMTGLYFQFIGQGNAIEPKEVLLIFLALLRLQYLR